MNTTYHPIAKTLHWVMALAIFGLLALGFVMHDMPLSPEKLQYFSWHKWAGISIFVLVWVRLVWRWISPPPPYAESMSINMQRLAHAGHLALYALMLIIPITGWLMSSAKGVPTVWFGVLPLPDLIGKDKALGQEVMGSLKPGQALVGVVNRELGADFDLEAFSYVPSWDPHMERMDLRLRAELRPVGIEHLAHAGAVDQVILALPATVDGATTSHYLAERLAPSGVALTVLARGLSLDGLDPRMNLPADQAKQRPEKREGEHH